MQAMSNSESMTHMFGDLNFRSLLCLHKGDIMLLFPSLEVLEKHVCEECYWGKCCGVLVSKDGSVRAICRLQLVLSDVCGQ